MGPGETSQGAALGKHLLSKGEDVSFVLLLEENRHFIANLKCPLWVTSDGEEVKSIISSGKFDAVILCNSKAMHKDEKFRTEAPLNKPFVVSLDSNWLFDQPDKFPYVQWIDKIYLNFPVDVYENGLAKSGGNYTIPSEVAKKIMPIGLVPSYEKPEESVLLKLRKDIGLLDGQKLIFSYIGSGVTLRKDFHDQYIAVMDEVYKNHGDKVKVLFLSGEEPDKPWILPLKIRTNSDVFYQLLAISDMVFQHQGLGTLEQCISATIPVIANVATPAPEEKIHAHSWEILPFVKAGLCKMHFYEDDVVAVSETIESLLYDDVKRGEMIQSQKEHYSCGEEEIHQDLINIIKEK
jgi:hypothetical protein